MSEIPFNFESCPSYFRKNGWFKNPKTCAFVTWTFSRCYSYSREIHHDGKKIVLEPYQFIFGREVCSLETGLTENEVRHQQNNMENAFFLKKAPNKTPKRFTIYEWVCASFLKDNNQVNHQEATKKQPTNHHKQDLTKPKSEIYIDLGIACEVLPFSKKEKSESKHPLKKEQQLMLKKLLDLKINTDESTFKFWIRTYSETKIDNAINHYQNELKNRPTIDNPGGFIHNILLGRIIPITPQVEENKKFAQQFAISKGWNNLKISPKFAKCEVTNSDVPLFLDSENFEVALNKLYDNSLIYSGL